MTTLRFYYYFFFRLVQAVISYRRTTGTVAVAGDKRVFFVQTANKIRRNEYVIFMVHATFMLRRGHEPRRRRPDNNNRMEEAA